VSSPPDQTWFGSAGGYRTFTAIKYLVYCLLSLNIFMFLREELLALQYTFVDDFGLGQVIQAFAATIDTAAWVILLLLFELETSVLDDQRIRGLTRWLLHGIRGICYVAIGYAFTGYYAELVTLYQATSLADPDVCAALGQGYSVLVDIDEYVPLDSGNCASLGADVVQLTGFDILASADTLQSARYLAWTDLLNSAAWILVVVVLEVEIRLQLRGELSEQVMNSTKFIKYLLYAMLFCAAFYWGYAGDFIDVWDASLWLFAFIFIELNVFEWQYETSQTEAATA
jgi:hypothetical protein